ncbi:MAG: class I SAM-dependent rRNA methyltransferase [Ignavibacteriae bacterium]|nr:class I SAM-dependent rRNA methyltransferase [Ignavibacteriota bacterium]
MQKQIFLKKNEHRRVIAGHPWVFSNEIRETKGSPDPGDIVELLAASGLSLGIGFFNPHSLISFRLLSNRIEEIDFNFFYARISQALELRKCLYPDSTVYRVVYGESDFLPGLVIDRFNDLLAVQTFSYGMDQRLAIICDALEAIFHPTGIVERNESPLRLLEKLPQQKKVLRGTSSPIIITENDIRYRVDILEGQKTGFFLDQRENRKSIERFSRGASALDCFCNEGGFALSAIRGGATFVMGIDSSESAIQRAIENATLNNMKNVVFERADVFEKLKELLAQGRSFDVVVLDPPSFTRSKKNVQTAKKGYKDLHAAALGLLKRGGTLLTASCSHHIESEVFLSIVNETALKAGRALQLLDWRGAAPDHPVLPGMPETRYLKFGIFKVL